MNSAKKRLIIINMAIPLATALFGSLLVNNGFVIYNSLRRPAISPPLSAFFLVWCVLYLLMGVSSYLISLKKNAQNEIDVYTCYVIYGLSLLLNVIWMLLFFKFRKFSIALTVILLIIAVIFSKIISLAKLSKTAAIIQIPYLFWSIFAAYLNLSIYAMN